MIIVRPFSETDRERIDAMHKSMGFDYEAPDWSKMLVSGVVEVDGKLTMASFLRMTAETYMLCDPETGSRKDKLGQMLILHREMIQPALKQGLHDIHAWLPPEIEKNFGNLLVNSFGWKKPLWPCYARELK